MRTLTLGRTGVEVAAVGFGTWPLGGPNQLQGDAVGWSGSDDAQSIAALLRAHELGIRHWDTADVYGDGHAERLIGQVWDRVPRASVFLATKVGWDPGGYDHYYHPRFLRDRIERSLQLLQTDTIDLYYLHHCDFGEDDRHLEPALEQLRRFRKDGKFRFLGLSDWDNAQVARLAGRVQPDVVQVYRNVVDDTYAASGLKAWVEGSGAGVAFFSPLKQGLLLGKYDRPPSFGEGDVRARIPGFNDQGVLDRLRAARRAVTARLQGVAEPMLDALISAVLHDATTACALQGLRNPRQVEQAARITAELSEDDVRFVREVYATTGAGGTF